METEILNRDPLPKAASVVRRAEILSPGRSPGSRIMAGPTPSHPNRTVVACRTASRLQCRYRDGLAPPSLLNLQRYPGCYIRLLTHGRIYKVDQGVSIELEGCHLICFRHQVGEFDGVHHLSVLTRPSPGQLPRWRGLRHLKRVLGCRWK